MRFSIWKFAKRCWPVVRILLSILLLWSAIKGLDWSALLSSYVNTDLSWLFLAAIAILLGYVLGGIRWGFLMRRVGFEGSLITYIALYFSGGLINQGLPSTLGGDSYRAIVANHLSRGGDILGKAVLVRELQNHIDYKQSKKKLRLSFFMTFIDRVLGLLGTCILGSLGLIFDGEAIYSWGNKLGLILFSFFFGFFILFSIACCSHTIIRAIKKGLDSLNIVGTIPGLMLAFSFPVNLMQIFVAVLIHLLGIFAFNFCLIAYGVDAPISALMIGLPTLSLLLMLPISLSGWGLRETTLSSVLLLWGIPSEIVVLASISYGAITLITLLPGAYFLFRNKKSAGCS